MKDLRHIWLIALKDLKLFSRDRLALLMFILFPFLFVTLFNVIFSSAGAQDDRFRLHFVSEEDRGSLSYHILDALETDNESELDPGEPVIYWDKSYEDDVQAINDNQIDGFITFPKDFTDGINLGYGTNLITCELGVLEPGGSGHARLG